ncbi:MAG TPA: NAD(+) diphosphatase [Terrimesophilobacter sp.]|nr:NAD(+) diphosphatase [Terrimesophilobacter sp.]HRP99742.1 NAD(+) diphosphatase [Terrimesophilobacter sp.]
MRDARLHTPPGATLPLARGGVDQDHLTRDNPEVLQRLLADEATRVIVVHRDRGLMGEALKTTTSDAVAETQQRPRLAFLPVSEAPDSLALVYLGRAADDPPDATDATDAADAADVPGGTAFFAAVLDAEAAREFAPEERWGSLRALGAQLNDLESTLLTQAVAIGNWHLDHRFSPLSGEPLRVEKAGWVLRAGPHEPEQFPRTDPVVIVAVTDKDDRLLLGSNALWEANRFSLLAGFVEPGESLEAAVEREVFEESGLRVIEPRYLGSQSWPFPRSLMLGFGALADPAIEQRLQPDGEEILELRWFSRDELTAARDIILPGRTSIARRLIEQWLGRPLEDDRW